MPPEAKKKLSRPFTVAYALLLGAFVVVEMIAVWRAEPGDTFSEHVWSLLGGPVSYTVIGGFLVWLLVHFLTKGKV